MAFKQKSPISVAEGGTNAVGFAVDRGVAVFEANQLISITSNTAGKVLTSNGPLVRPTFEKPVVTGIVTLAGNTGTSTGSTVTVRGNSNVTTSATSATLTINLNDTVSISGSMTAGTGLISTTGGLTLSNFTEGALITSSVGVSSAVTGTAGFVLTANTAGTAPSFQALVPSFTWNNVTGATQAIAVENGYISNNGATLVTLTLPATAAVGALISVQGSGTGLWTIAQNASQTIHFNAVDSTTGVGGTVSSTSRYDSIALLCITTNNDWAVYTSVGTFTVV